ncbi:unnamed protein product [Dibothriocephalus latus]|uniref:C2H2-type domain-containing protein n=1 Tax=Dibothriocephalus latus TaxID=60516 RepID=A0A3P7LL58_DIBLA|nr:unnamed protein product [Dibothriocephalus latus]
MLTLLFSSFKSQLESSSSKQSFASRDSVPPATQPEGRQRAERDQHKWMCSICECNFQEEKDYITHITSKKHLQRESNSSKHSPAAPDSVPPSTQPEARQRANRDQHKWMCSVCQCDFQEEKDYITHLSTEEHLQRESNSTKHSSTSRDSMPPSTQPEGRQQMNQDLHRWMCSICKCGFEEEEDYITHLSTEEHIAKEQASAAIPTSSVPQKEALAPGLQEHPPTAHSGQPKGNYEEVQLEWHISRKRFASLDALPHSNQPSGHQN